MRKTGLLFATAAVAVLAGSGVAPFSAVWAAEQGEGAITAYPAVFFAPAQPYSAFDMLQRLPGFTFEGGDNAVRGLAGAAGNVLIDGKRPSSKQDSLEAALRRIPASAVARVELIRAGAPGVDMQGKALLANVVRIQAASLRGRVEADLTGWPDNGAAPSLSGEVSRRAGDRYWELSAGVARKPDPEKGAGPLRRFAPDGTLLRDGIYREDQADDVAEAAAGYERALGGGKLRADLSLRRQRTFADILEARSFPGFAETVVTERETVDEGEVGLRYDRALGERWRTELRGLHHQTRTDARDVEDDGDETSVSTVRSAARESIVQAVLRREGAKANLEFGGEAAINELDSRVGLTEDGVDIPLPAAAVRVEERRAEVFASVSWRMRPGLTLDVGSRFEASELTQSGDSALTKSLTYLKPRALLTWSPGDRDQVRLEVVRLVGQLDFKDFVSSASLTAGQVTAGNPDLEPDRTWRVSAAWERRIGEAGSLVLTLRHDRIEDVVDRIPVIGPGYAFDAPGNIGDGTRTELELNARLPLDGLRMAGGLLKADVIWRRSKVTDPVTGETRGISGEPRLEGKVGVTQDLPRWKARWGVEATLGETEHQYRFDEVKTDRLATRVGAFVEYRPTPAWSLKLHADNLTDGVSERRRVRYDGARGPAGPERIDDRRMRFGPFVGITVQRAFGG